MILYTEAEYIVKDLKNNKERTDCIYDLLVKINDQKEEIEMLDNEIELMKEEHRDQIALLSD